MSTIPATFRDTNYEPIPYDGSPIGFRLSVYGVFVHEGKVLLVHHRDDIYWDIPGGGVELAESLEEALRREGLEEAGCELQLKTILGHSQDWFYHKKLSQFFRSLQLFVLAEGSMPLVPPSDPEVKEVGFFSWPEVQQRLYPHVIAEIEPMLKKLGGVEGL